MPIFETTDTYVSGSGNWVCPAGVYVVWVECWGSGAGGGGGSAANQGGGGGGGGGYAGRWIRVTPGNSYAYVVGAAGSGASGDTDGFDGNPSYFINSSAGCRAEGGLFGSGGVNAGVGGYGGAPTYYDVGYTGGKGSDQTPNGGGGGGSAGTGSNGNDVNFSSTGATAVTGGGNGGNGGSTGNGSAPTVAPGGGGGGGGFPLSGSRNGGAGKAGQVKVSYAKMRVFGSSMMVQ